MDLLPEIVRRVSVREFVPKPIEGEVLDRILDAGRLAPSAKNRQPWRFVVFRDAEKKARLQEASFGQEHVGAAAAVIACCSTNTEYRMTNGQPAYPIDISMAASFMMLQAVREGLGTCIVTTYDESLVQDVVAVPYSMRVVLLLLLGYPAGEVSEHHERFSGSRIISFDHW